MKYVVISGSLTHGLTAVGPFQSLADAIQLANTRIEDNSVAEVVTLDESHNPPTPSPKFALGQKVWTMHGNAPIHSKVVSVKQTLGQGGLETYYWMQSVDAVIESKVFATKQELLDSL